MIPGDRESMARAEDRWLEPPIEAEPEMGECLRCDGKGHERPRGLGGDFVECSACGGSGKVELGPYEEEYERE